MAAAKAPGTRETPEIERQLRHADGCPRDRTESWETETPDGTPVVVARCLDCPAHDAKPK